MLNVSRRALLVVLTLFIAPTGVIASEQGPHVPLIPREVLFGNPDRANVRLSHDGRFLSWLAPLDGVLNIWVAPADEPKRATPITNDRGRGIRSYFWAYDNEHVLYVQDTDGDEDFRLYSVDVASKETRALTSGEPILGPDGEPLTDPSNGRPLRPTVTIDSLSHTRPGEIVIGLNDRDPRYHDLHTLDLATGEMELLQINEGYAGFVLDDEYRVRLAAKPRPDGGSEFFVKSGGEWSPFRSIDLEDTLTTRPLGFDATGRLLYMLDSQGRDTAALTAIDLVSGESRVLVENERADISGYLVHPTKGTMQGASSNYLRRTWKLLDTDLTEDFSTLRAVSDGDMDISSRTLDDRRWVVAFSQDDEPTTYHLYDRDTRRTTFLFTNRSALENLPLAEMHPVVIPARDGLSLVSYYSLPVWTDEDGDARPDQPLSTVLLVHGGPWARDSWGLNAMHQWLANRGHAVLSVNFRGSTGFGKEFVNAGNLEWADAMHDDLIDAVDWAVEQGIADRERVAIMGGSYGGYATLAGLTFTPDVFAAGVSIVGPSNLVTLLDSIPAYWQSFRDQLRRRVGDIDTPQGRILLRSRSPLTHVDEIVRPLLIGQGANDPRVKQAESDQIVEAMTKRGIPVTYALYPDEGHGFARPENRLSFFAVTEAFLAEHIGGAYEEIGDDLEGSSITVPVGADDVPGLGGEIGG